MDSTVSSKVVEKSAICSECRTPPAMINAERKVNERIKGLDPFCYTKSYCVFTVRSKNVICVHPRNGDRSISDRSRFHSLFYGRVERMRAEGRGIAGTCLLEAVSGATPRSAIPMRGAANSIVKKSSLSPTHDAAIECVRRSSPGFDSDRSQYLHPRVGRNPPDRGLPPLAVPALNLINPDNRAAMPLVEGSIHR